MKTLKSIILTLFAFFLLTACSSNSGAEDEAIENSDGYVEPQFDPNSSWIYMEDCPSLVNFYAQNNRPFFRKWIASKKASTFIFEDNALSFSFENTDKYTRYLMDKLNQDGKETVSILVKGFTKSPPQSGTFSLDGFSGDCWYNVLNSNNIKIDSTRIQGSESSSFNVTNWNHVVTSGEYSIYTMSGTAVLNIMYWKNGTSSTTDIHKLLITFNKVEVTFKD